MSNLTSPDMLPGLDAAGVWMSVSDLAKRKGLKKQTVAERVARFEDKGLVHTRPGPGRTKLVNIAEFDRAAGETIDLARALAGGADLEEEPPAAAPPSVETQSASKAYTAQQALKTSYEAELKRLDLDERLGKLLPLEKVTEAMTRCADVMVRKIDQLPSHADDLAAAVASQGSNGAARLLKTIAHDLRDQLAKELSALASSGESADLRDDAA